MATSVEEVAMNIRYRVELSEVERGKLRAMLSGGKHAARKLKRAQILLAADAGVADETIAISLDVGVSTGLPREAPLRGGRLGTGAPRGAAPGCGAQAHRRQKMWCIPRVNGEFVARMEDVLDLYAEAPDPRHRQLVGRRSRKVGCCRP
jgi:hypothetical protein